jgi:mono/diheme cytochrome c family protein
MRVPALTLALSLAATAFAPAQQPDGAAFFEKEVRPVLRKNCVGCHNPQVNNSGLSLANREAVLEGGNRGSSFNPASPTESLLLSAVRQSGDLKMPPGGKLKDEEIAVIERWVEMGLPWSKTATAAGAAGPRSTHWAFQPVKRPDPPAILDPWIRNPIDAFVLARLRKEGIAPSPEAAPATLRRRVSLDLTGLPPSGEDASYEEAVDSLLASPHYGERWGRHWLDLARYADSNGYNIDGEREIWKYRDWVIDALNRDMPFDQFVTEQIAGDLLPDPTEAQLVATGFHRNTLINLEGGIDFEQYRVDAVADRVDTTGAVFLGLTLGCARCHDHKYDPVSQREYYQFYAFFNDVDELAGNWGEAGRRRAHEPLLFFGTAEEKQQKQAVRAQLEALDKELTEYKATLDPGLAAWEKNLAGEERKKLKPEIQYILTVPAAERSSIMRDALNRVYYQTDPGYRQRQATIRAVAKMEPKLASTMVMRELPQPREAYIHLGGDFLRKGVTVQPGVPRVLPTLQAEGRPNRLHLARWLTDPANPLTARVTVNRIWQRLFGRGLVESENDFGAQGAKPSHPELLDWLVSEFVRGGWSQKNLLRLIVTSATYRQSSNYRRELESRDPNNELLARQSRLRLEGEIVRDNALAASGLLNPELGGKSVFPPQPAGASKLGQIQREWVAETGPNRYRRGLYTHFWRSAPDPNLMIFDAPDSTTACTRRMRSNTPLQSLTLLNDEGFFELAQGLAKRVQAEAADGDDARLRLGFRLCTSRDPKPEELDRLRRFLNQQRDGSSPPAEETAWVQVARVLMNLDEFITRE